MFDKILSVIVKLVVVVAIGVFIFLITDSKPVGTLVGVEATNWTSGSTETGPEQVWTRQITRNYQTEQGQTFSGPCEWELLLQLPAESTVLDLDESWSQVGGRWGHDHAVTYSTDGFSTTRTVRDRDYYLCSSPSGDEPKAARFWAISEGQPFPPPPSGPSVTDNG